jgi:hypothetical protein
VSAAAYRARSATELIDATFQLLRRNFAQFYTLAALLWVPLAIIPRLLAPNLQPGTPVDAPAVGASFFISFGVFFLLFIVLSAIFQTAMFYASSDAYLGRPVDTADVLKRGVRQAGLMAYGYFAQSLCIGLAFLLLIIPSIYVGLALFAVPCVIAIEHVDVGTALSRSWELSKGLKGHICLTLFLAGVIYGVGALIVGLVANLVAGGLGHVTILSQTVNALGTSLLVPVPPLALTLLYYDARIRKEGYDIELMAQQVGGSAATTKPQPA